MYEEEMFIQQMYTTPDVFNKDKFDMKYSQVNQIKHIVEMLVKQFPHLKLLNGQYKDQ